MESAIRLSLAALFCISFAAAAFGEKNVNNILYSESMLKPFDEMYEIRPLVRRETRDDELRRRQKRGVDFTWNGKTGKEHLLSEHGDDDDDDEDEEEFINSTSADHLRSKANESLLWNNATYKQVSHRYYTFMPHSPESNMLDAFWQDTAALAKKHGLDEPHHKQLSNSYRRAVSNKLSFKFPFYGHYVENITIATGGFVYVGEHVHSWLAATQYIAPLMANFDTTMSEDASVLSIDTGDMFVVEWNNVVLRQQKDAGNFTFQVVLHKNGDIWFSYKHVPIPVKGISDFHHPLKVGLSDAYLFTHTVFTMSRRVVYEYHRIELPLDDVKSGAVFEIKAMPVCISYQTCSSCMNTTLAQFNCSWCPVPGEQGGPFCSDEQGLHRRRQDWLNAQCYKQIGQVYCSGGADETSANNNSDKEHQGGGEKENKTTNNNKPVGGGGGGKKEGDLGGGGGGADQQQPQVPVDKVVPIRLKGKNMPDEITAKRIHEGGMSSGAIGALLFVLGTVVGLVGWLVYAYYNPHTPSGQFLIRYRPTRWRLPGNHGDVRYTASVHM